MIPKTYHFFSPFLDNKPVDNDLKTENFSDGSWSFEDEPTIFDTNEIKRALKLSTLLSINDESKLKEYIKTIEWADKYGIFVDISTNNDLSLNLINLKIRQLSLLVEKILGKKPFIVYNLPV